MSKYSIVTLEEVHSTNTYALENILFLEDKTIIYTTKQTEGRGRYNRKWISDNSENLYMSVILKPNNIKNYPYQNLTQYLSVIVCRVLEKEFDLKPEIKWPNDILINGYKISGILAESYTSDNQIKGIVLGLGLNVNLKKETLEKIDQKAVSIYSLTGKYNDTEKILHSICNLFFESYEKFINNGFSFIKNEYESRCSFLGKSVSIREISNKKEFLAESIDSEGLLIIRDEFGNESKIITGDVLC